MRTAAPADRPRRGRLPSMRAARFFLLALGLPGALAAAQQSQLEVNVFLYRPADFAASGTFAFVEGRPASDAGIEDVIHREISRRLKAKGWLPTAAEEADLLIKSEGLPTFSAAVGMLRVDVLHGPRGKEELSWRGLATGIRSTSSRANEKLVSKAIRRMLKKFPEASSP